MIPIRSGSGPVRIFDPVAHWKGAGAHCYTVSVEGNMCSTVFRRQERVHYCYQEKESGALLLSRRRKLVLYCSCFREKGTGALLFSGEG